MSMNRKIVLASHPEGEAQIENFALQESPLPEPREGQALIRNSYISVDPYMRGAIAASKPSQKRYNREVLPGQVMIGGTVGKVVASKSKQLPEGAIVAAFTGWQDYGLVTAAEARIVDPNLAPISTALGVLGMPGETAYFGLLDIGKPKPGETILVSAATGAVGSVVGQIAKLMGCRTVGIAGGPDKCRLAVEEYGYDVCIDHRGEKLTKAVAQACPAGVDVYFDNVGGRVLDAALANMNMYGRVALCGMISGYDTQAPEAIKNLMVMIYGRMSIQGFIVSDFVHRRAEAHTRLAQWIKEGKLRYREDITEGLENAPHAFLRMLKGGNVGKTLVKIA